MIRFVRRFRWTVTLLVVIGATTLGLVLDGYGYHGHESWWRLLYAACAGGSVSAVSSREARHKR